MFDQDELHEECGVFGVFGHNNAADLCYYGLHSLQHEGKKQLELLCKKDINLAFIKAKG